MSVQLVPARRVRVDSELRTLRIGLAGCGVVGSAFVRLLHERRSFLAAQHGINVEVAALLVRDVERHRQHIQQRVPITADPARFLESNVDLVVECLGGVDVPNRIAAGALFRGIPFVTANKALIAAHGDELHDAARAAGTYIGFEAAVAGGAPVIRTVTDALQHAGIVGVQGILNGTTNFVISRVAAGASFQDAVSEAQRLGFAEADPSRDLSGADAADKLAVLSWLAFGVKPSALRIERRGIDADLGALCHTAATVGGALRLVAEASLTHTGVVAVVEPVVVDAASPFARVAAEENLLSIVTCHAGTIRVSGPGAGGDATAVSLLADVLRPIRLQPPASTASAVEDTQLHDWFVAVPAAAAARVGTFTALRNLPLTATGYPGIFSARAASRRSLAALAREAARAGVNVCVLRYVRAA